MTVRTNYYHRTLSILRTLNASTIVVFIALVIFSVNVQASSLARNNLSKQTEDARTDESFWNPSSYTPITVITTFLLVINAAQAGLFWWQLRLIRKTLKTTEDQVKNTQETISIARAALPRAWLYIEMAAKTGPNVTFGVRGGIIIPIAVRNYGELPATIIDIQCELYITGPESHLDGFEIVPIPFYGDGTTNAIKTTNGLMAYGYKGVTILPKGEIVATDIHHYPSPVPLRGREKFLRLIVRYADPAGDDRETGYIGKLGPTPTDDFVSPIIDRRYSYHL